MVRKLLGESRTANEDLHRGYDSTLWTGMILATALHFGVFTAWPEMYAPEIGSVSEAMLSVEFLEDIPLPKPPEPLPRPVAPVITDAFVPDDVTMAPTTWDANPPDVLAPPQAAAATSGDNVPRFVPFTVAPTLRNRDEVIRAMERAYPPLLRDAGIGGTVDVFLRIDEEGSVVEARINQGSAHASLDAAALDVAYVYRFSPALNRDRPVAVWVSVPVTFQVRR